MTVKEFKHDYFSFKGRLNRKPFLMRLMMLGAISIFFVLIVINAEPHLKEAFRSAYAACTTLI